MILWNKEMQWNISYQYIKANGKILPTTSPEYASKEKMTEKELKRIASQIRKGIHRYRGEKPAG